ncbi:hypothetical protein Aduo_007617 [Ancylostoma duodenale]
MNNTTPSIKSIRFDRRRRRSSSSSSDGIDDLSQPSTRGWKRFRNESSDDSDKPVVYVTSQPRSQSKPIKVPPPLSKMPKILSASAPATRRESPIPKHTGPWLGKGLSTPPPPPYPLFSYPPAPKTQYPTNCPLCSGDHAPQNCCVNVPFCIKDTKLFTEAKLCGKRLRPHHVSTCVDQIPCRKCGQSDHSTVLCTIAPKRLFFQYREPGLPKAVGCRKSAVEALGHNSAMATTFLSPRA